MKKFILEIGTEELPARFLPNLELELAEKAAALLAEADLAFSSLGVSATPRRSLLQIDGLAAAQPLREEVVTGPALRAAYDETGQPTKAALGFAKGQGVDMGDLFQLETDKGVYVAARKKVGGNTAESVLPGLLQNLISSLTFPKRMRWGDGDFAFARPLRWLLALLDDQVVDFCVGKVRSGRKTWGHRIHGPGPFEVGNASQIGDVLSGKCKITVSGAERRELIVAMGNGLAKDVGGKVLWKDSLLTEVQGLTEHPVPMIGDFDPSYLELPRQVLLTSMESHQKSFGLEDGQGRLLPHFLTVLNLTPPEPQIVKKGWERVLRARLEDARFYWRTDLKADFDLWLDKLENVIFLGPLGSMADKTRRLQAMCSWLAERVQADSELAALAGRMSKADLVTQMVGEFDTLQGIMGGIYAREKGFDPALAEALAEQYLPAGPDSPLPGTLLGAILSLADKVDTMVGCFGLGNIPTGAADPYALRRCALGVARIIMDRGWRIDVSEIFAKAWGLYSDDADGIAWKLGKDEALDKLEAFFAGRLKNLFLSQGYETLLVEAVMGATAADGGPNSGPKAEQDVWAAKQRLLVLAEASREPDFSGTAQTFKRVSNILRKQEEKLSGLWQEDYLRDEAEHHLAHGLIKLETGFGEAWKADDYAGAYACLGEIRPLVDNFFDQVMVMDEDANLRRNRLNMLQALLSHMEKIADFSALQI